jgi:hypothetical protein
MKIDLTTGTWQDNPGCPINITLVSTSDGVIHRTIYVARCVIVVFLTRERGGDAERLYTHIWDDDCAVGCVNWGKLRDPGAGW